MRRGILGGTFDPPHHAHLHAGEAAHHQLGLDVVTYVPAGAPWQKAGSAVSAPVHRLRMTELAVAGVGHFEVDDREVHREGWTYTIDTLDSFSGDDDLVVILGADAARGIRTWHRHEDLLARAEIAVVPRSGVTRDELDAALDGARWRLLDAATLDVSGTELRALVGTGTSIRFLVPEAVRAYIAEHGLYVPD